MHWTMTVEERCQGWLSERWHRQFREILLHTLARHRLVCPIYCVMPDHLHLVWVGVEATSDQVLAARFFRRHTNELLAPREWQRQAYDNVLGPNDRAEAAFQKVCGHILENPVRAGLVADWADYAFSGAMMPGFPTLSLRRDDYWMIFWQVYGETVNEEEKRSGKLPNT